jgi:hypothetical protein
MKRRELITLVGGDSIGSVFHRALSHFYRGAAAFVMESGGAVEAMRRCGTKSTRGQKLAFGILLPLACDIPK